MTEELTDTVKDLLRDNPMDVTHVMPGDVIVIRPRYDMAAQKMNNLQGHLRNLKLPVTFLMMPHNWDMHVTRAVERLQ